ncbi:MAG: TonB-dependent receptor plug domain-containing protein, partial [Gammaproteobacteria bacterium]|nr:TonB-dependent receptor plug domain-containing protein [Gammaproteobacteria bacterium]
MLSVVAVSFVVIDIGTAFAAELEEILVTARKREESVRDIPVAVTAVSGEQLERYSLMRLEDVAELTPQLSIFRGTAGNAASINIRGIGPTTTSIGIEQSAVVIMDGAYYGQGRIINEGLFDTAQIEILKGPQALFFGKNATAGAINIATNDPGEETEIIVGSGYEFDAEEWYVEGIVSGRINEQLGVRLATRYSKQ